MQTFIEPLIQWLLLYKFSISLSVLIIILYFVSRRIIIPRIEKSVERGGLKDPVFRKAVTALSLSSGMLAIAIILFVWGFDFRELLALSTGLIALTGVALFASWSVLSNITSFFLLLTHRHFRRGDFIRIIDADNYIEGYISEINLFNTKLITEDQEIIIYPNNLITSRPNLINPRNRYSVVGKILEFSEKPEAPEQPNKPPLREELKP